MRAISRELAVAAIAALLAGISAPALAQQEASARLLQSVADAMGGKERLQRIGNLALTGFGQQVYLDGGGNVTGDVNAPPKWRALADAQRTFDLAGGRAVLQERRSFMFPFAAPFGISMEPQRHAADGCDAARPSAAGSPQGARGRNASSAPSRWRTGSQSSQFTTAEGTPVWMAVDPATHLPAWTRRIVPHANLGDVAVTSYFTGYVPYDGVPLPLGLMTPHRLA